MEDGTESHLCHHLRIQTHGEEGEGGNGGEGRGGGGRRGGGVALSAQLDHGNSEKKEKNNYISENPLVDHTH